MEDDANLFCVRLDLPTRQSSVIRPGHPTDKVMVAKMLHLRSLLAVVVLSACGRVEAVLQVATGRLHTCVILNDHSVKCFGAGRHGNLGTGGGCHVRGKCFGAIGAPGKHEDIGAEEANTMGGHYNEQTPVKVCAENLVQNKDGTVPCTVWVDGAVDERKATQLAVSRFGWDFHNGVRDHILAHTCIVFKNGALKCFGSNVFGQLGRGSISESGKFPTPVCASDSCTAKLDGTTAALAVQVSTGGFHTCVVFNSGALRCFGMGTSGQLGTGEDYTNCKHKSHSFTFVQDDCVATPKLVCAHEKPAGASTCSAWINGSGGDDTIAEHVSAGQEHTCVIFRGGALRCFGNNAKGQLGIGTQTNKAFPTLVCAQGQSEAAGPCSQWVDGGDNGNTDKSAVQVSAGDTHTCMLLKSGAVRCFGENGGGSPKIGTGKGNLPGAQQFPELVCLQTNGLSSYNQDCATAIDGVDDSRTAVAVSAGRKHTCVILKGGALKCFGGGNDGTLGTGDGDERYLANTYSCAHSGVSKVDTCTKWIDGTNSSEVADEGVGGSAGCGGKIVPVERIALSVSAGFEYTCAILRGGLLRCFGKAACSNSGGVSFDAFHDGGGRLGMGNTYDDVYFPTVVDVGQCFDSAGDFSFQ